MKVEQDGDVWTVIDNDDKPVKTFGSSAEAWRWVDRNETRPAWVSRKRAEKHPQRYDVKKHQ